MLETLARALRRLSQCDPPAAIETTPAITLSETEHRQLNVLAMAGEGHDAAASDRLYWELDRARVVPESELPPSIVRMGSIVTYRAEEGDPDTVRLAYPGEVKGASSLSVLTPLGTALIGVATGDVVRWSSGDQAGTATVVSVRGP